ncbi:protein SHOOT GRAVITROPISM 6-like [Diaphorina citri]|uniref:Protein SHOOT GRAVITROPISM 6-like n=1 Tax=Diaphorina citri TaxID=121845 RepID=A0A3Q0IRG6_DIACI|nr:protein SHOOT GRAVITROPISM 6-like [Diaphorina citri]
MLNSVYKFFYDENKNSKNADPPDISSVIGSLVEATWSDKDDVVRETISTALLQLSTPFSQLILQSIITFRKSHPKLSLNQVHSLLKAVEQICQEHPGDILPPLLNQVIEFSLDELTKTPQDPLPASAILVALGQNHCNNVMECLKPRLQGGGGDQIPNVSMIYTLGYLLEFLKLYASTLNTKLPDIMNEKIPPLVDYLKLSDWNSDEWERELRELTHVIISNMDRDWAVSFASQLSVQFYVTSDVTTSQERVTLMYCLGVTLCLLEDRTIIHSHLDTIINTLRTNSSASSQSCAKAVGIVASKHLTLVLSRLDALVKSELTRKSSRLLGLLRDTRQEMEIEKARLTLLYSYAYVVKEAPPSELAPQLANLCQFFISQLTICKEGDCNEACLLAIDNTLQAIYQNPATLAPGLEFKPQILTLVLSQVQAAQAAPKPIILKTIGSLLKLPPLLPLNECSNILKITIAKVRDLWFCQYAYCSSTAMT